MPTSMAKICSAPASGCSNRYHALANSASRTSSRAPFFGSLAFNAVLAAVVRAAPPGSAGLLDVEYHVGNRREVELIVLLLQRDSPFAHRTGTLEWEVAVIVAADVEHAVVRAPVAGRDHRHRHVLR